VPYSKVFRSIVKRAPDGFDGANHNPSFGVGLYLHAAREKPPVIEFMALPDSRIRPTSGSNLLDRLVHEFHQDSESSGSTLLNKFKALYTSDNADALSPAKPIHGAIVRVHASPLGSGHHQAMTESLSGYVNTDGPVQGLRKAGIVEQSSEVLAGPILTGIKDMVEGNFTKSAIQASVAFALWGKAVSDEAKASPYGPATYAFDYLKTRTDKLKGVLESAGRESQAVYDELVEVFEHQAYISSGLKNAQIMVVEPSAIYYSNDLQLINQTCHSDLEKQGIPMDARIYQRNDTNCFELCGAFADDSVGGIRQAADAGFDIGRSETLNYRRLFHAAHAENFELASPSSVKGEMHTPDDEELEHDHELSFW
jgi:hypothetical protein